MKTVIQADELAKDVAGAEAFLERHQEHKVWAIGGRGVSYNCIACCIYVISEIYFP